jgi:Ca2+-transporting ATPase
VQEIIAGLSAADVVRIRASGGFNELSSAKARSPIIRILRILTQPMFLLLIIAGVVSMILAEPLDAAVLLVMVFGVMAITIYQEGRAEKALGALSQLAAPKANVLRDGEWETLPARELVVGDICRIHEGDRIPADVELLETTNLLLDESMLTGESLPVAKTASE